MESTSPHRERGWLLARQGRPEMAEREYRLALADDPGDAAAHAMLALLLAEQDGRRDEALREAREAIGLAPDETLPHYAEARVHLEAERWAEAERAARQAVLLAPHDADLHALLAAVHLGGRRWPAALAAAEEALECDPEHVGAANLRASALVHLGRRGEAAAAIQGALARSPESSHTHANHGWGRLHAGDRRGALESFREALRLDPESEWAREGLAEALKARNPLYAAMLRYFLWMNRLDGRTRWMVIIGGLLGYRVLRGVAAQNPGLAPWILPLLVAYGVFVLLSWTAPQIFNAVLLLSPDGRYVLSPEQRRSGTVVGAALLLALGVAGAALLGGANGVWLSALLFGMLLMPLAATFRGPRGGPTRVMSVFTGLLYLLAVGHLGLEAAGDRASSGSLFGLVVLCVVASSWVINLRGR